jgi:SAM-dependent methyltransferase
MSSLPQPQPPSKRKPSLWLKDRDYAACHAAFRRASNEWETARHWFLTSEFFDFEPAIRARVLSVGCGDGAMDQLWLERLADHPGGVDYHGLDPNGLSLAAFVSGAAPSGKGPPMVLHAVRSRFEDYHPAAPFDRILFAHSLYHFPDRGGVLARAAGFLEPGGRLLVMVSDDEGLPAFKAGVYRRAAMPAQSQETPGSDLRRHLAALPLRTRFHTVSTVIDATECLRKSPEGILLLNFFFLLRFENLNADQQAAILDELPRHCTQRDGRWLLDQPMLIAESTLLPQD